jgi:uncharacterized membrane protein HdeD (DUF308 family)
MGTAPSAPPFATTSTADPADALQRAHRWLLIAGVLSLLGGIAAIVLPNVASVTMAIFIGWLLVFASALDVVDAFSTRGDASRAAVRLLLALLTFAAGVYLLVAPLDGTFTLTVVLVIWFVAMGTARIVTGIADRGRPGAGMLVLNGVLSLALGLLIALQLPSSAGWAIGLLVGVDLIFSGTLLIGLAQRLRVPADR